MVFTVGDTIPLGANARYYYNRINSICNSCDPGGVSDGSRLAVYLTLSLYRVPFFVLRACFISVYAMLRVPASHLSLLPFAFVLLFCSCFFLSFCRFCLPLISVFCFLFLCFMLSSELCRCPSDIFLSSRPRTGLVIIAYITGYA